MTCRIDQKALENPGSPGAALLDFFVNSMFVTVRAELFQFHPGRVIPTILLRGIARHSRRALSRIRATFCTFQRHYNTNTFSHFSI